MTKHLVLTRIGLGVFNQDWHEQMFGLFEAVTFPSMKSQLSQDFIWLIVIDVGMPGAVRRKLESLIKPHGNFHLVTTDVTNMRHMRLGTHDWIYLPCQDYVLSNRLIEDVRDYIVTSIIDADDAWNKSYVSVANKYFSRRKDGLAGSEAGRGSHVQHSAGHVLTFSRGLMWYLSINAVKPMKIPYFSTAVSVMARFSSGISAWSSRHAAWAAAAELPMFTTEEVVTKAPMYAYMRHDRSAMGWSSDNAKPMSDEMTEKAAAVFCIDLPKLQAWRRTYLVDQSGSPRITRHQGRNSRAQYNRLFHLSALNLQIDQLSKAVGGRNPDKSAMDDMAKLLEQKTSERKALLALIYAEGDAFYSGARPSR